MNQLSPMRQRILDYVTELVGVRPDGYVLIDLDVFVDLVDKMGGVKFDVPCDMDYSDPANITPMFFRAQLEDGVLEVGRWRTWHGGHRPTWRAHPFK